MRMYKVIQSKTAHLYSLHHIGICLYVMYFRVLCFVCNSLSPNRPQSQPLSRKQYSLCAVAKELPWTRPNTGAIGRLGLY